MFNNYDSMDFLEPKCPKCGTLIEYGVSTTFDEKKNTHVCNKCNHFMIPTGSYTGRDLALIHQQFEWDQGGK